MAFMGREYGPVASVPRGERAATLVTSVRPLRPLVAPCRPAHNAAARPASRSHTEGSDGRSSANEPRAVDGGQGVTWWTDAWALFTKNAAIWVVLGLILFIILVVLAFIPLI